MKPEFEEIQLTKNENLKRFEIEIDHHFAFIVYKENETQISLLHTEVDEELSGKGAATAVIEKTLQYIKNSGKKLLPYCPLVAAYLQKNPEWKIIVDENFKI